MTAKSRSAHRFALATCAMLACAAWSSARADEFTLSGSIIALRGSGLVLSNGSENLVVSANGTFTFPTPLVSGTSYNVTVVTRPSSPTQACLVANGRGTITANVTNVQVACVTSMFRIGGTITGFDGSGLVLRNNGETLAVSSSGAFTFLRGVRSGEAYNVTVETQPEHPIQSCVVTDGSGTIGSSNVDTVRVVCTTPPALRLLSSTPAPQATDVGRTEPFVLNFAAPLDPQTVDPSRVLLNNWVSDEPLAVSVSGAQLTITPPMQLRPSTPYFITVGAGVRANSGEVLVDDVHVNFTTRAASWQPAQTLVQSAGVFFAAPVIAGRGEKFAAVWKHLRTLAVRRYAPRTGWSDVAVSVPDSPEWINDLQVFLDAAGTAYTLYDNNHDRLELRRHTISDGWMPIEPLLIGDTSRIGTWQAGMDGAGNIIVAWTSIRFDNRYEVRASRYVPGSGWGTAVWLSDSGFDGRQPRVAVDAAGNAMVIWQQFGTDGFYFDIFSRRYTPGSGWALTQRIDGGNNASPNDMQITMDPLGNAMAVYTRVGDVMANYYDRSTGGWGTPAAIESSAGTSTEPKVVFDEYDYAFYAAWIQSGASATHEIHRNKSQGNQWSNTAQRIATSTGQFQDLRLAVTRNDHHETELFVATDVSNLAANVIAVRNIRGRGWVTETLAPRATNSGRAIPQLTIDASGSALALWRRDPITMEARVFE